jgi:hypothetical protein
MPTTTWLSKRNEKSRSESVCGRSGQNFNLPGGSNETEIVPHRGRTDGQTIQCDELLVVITKKGVALIHAVSCHESSYLGS